MRINSSTGLAAGLNANASTQRSMDKTLKQLSTGYRVNSASDDAAGLAISEKLRSQVRGSAQARRNTLDGISMLNVAEGGLNEIQALLQRGRELSVKSATDSITSADRVYLNLEAKKVIEEIDRISETTQFNQREVFNNGKEKKPLFPDDQDPFALQIGANGNADDALGLNFGGVSTTSIGVKDIDMTTQTGAVGAITLFDEAIGSINKTRSNIGTISARLEKTAGNLYTSETSLQSAESQIRDTDFAMTSSEFTKQQILSQSSISMIAQANTQRKSVLNIVG